jgi:hypothetical protein
MSVPDVEVSLDEVLAQLSPEGRLHWENAMLKARLAAISREEVGQTEE